MRVLDSKKKFSTFRSIFFFECIFSPESEVPWGDCLFSPYVSSSVITDMWTERTVFVPDFKRTHKIIENWIGKSFCWKGECWNLEFADFFFLFFSKVPHFIQKSLGHTSGQTRTKSIKWYHLPYVFVCVCVRSFKLQSKRKSAENWLNRIYASFECDSFQWHWRWLILLYVVPMYVFYCTMVGNFQRYFHWWYVMFIVFSSVYEKSINTSQNLLVCFYFLLFSLKKKHLFSGFFFD